MTNKRYGDIEFKWGYTNIEDNTTFLVIDTGDSRLRYSPIHQKWADYIETLTGEEERRMVRVATAHWKTEHFSKTTEKSNPVAGKDFLYNSCGIISNNQEEFFVKTTRVWASVHESILGPLDRFESLSEAGGLLALSHTYNTDNSLKESCVIVSNMIKRMNSVNIDKMYQTSKEYERYGFPKEVYEISEPLVYTELPEISILNK